MSSQLANAMTIGRYLNRDILIEAAEREDAVSTHHFWLNNAKGKKI